MAKIINFHEIKDPNWFQDVIHFLLAKYSPCRIEDIQNYYAGGKLKENAIHITIDDGSITDHSIIYPMLKNHNLQASIFVSPYIIKNETNFWFQEIQGYDDRKIKEIIAEKFNMNLNELENFYYNSLLKNMKIDDILDIISIYQKKYKIDKKNRKNMNVSELLELKNSGHFTIGAHTQRHPILANETDEMATDEIKNSVIELSDLLNEEVKLFAFPNGKKGLDFGNRELEILKNCKIECAFSLEHYNTNPKKSVFEIPRFGLSENNKTPFKRKIALSENLIGLKNKIFNNENKHRLDIKKNIRFL